MNEEYRKGYQAGFAAGRRSKPLTDMSKVIIPRIPMKTGNWVGIDDFPHDSWECNGCGFVIDNDNSVPEWAKYCPNCGARMEEDDNDLPV